MVVFIVLNSFALGKADRFQFLCALDHQAADGINEIGQWLELRHHLEPVGHHRDGIYSFTIHFLRFPFDE
jgi:hypothetical protein